MAGIISDASAGANQAATYSAQTAGPITNWNVDPNQLASTHSQRLIADNSPIIQQARTAALQQQNSSGTLNSSMAITAGQGAAYQAALPLAMSDAGTYSKAAQYNADEANQFGMFNAGQANNASAANALASNTLNNSNLSRAAQLQMNSADNIARAASDANNYKIANEGNVNQLTINQQNVASRAASDLNQFNIAGAGNANQLAMNTQNIGSRAASDLNQFNIAGAGNANQLAMNTQNVDSRAASDLNQFNIAGMSRQTQLQINQADNAAKSAISTQDNATRSGIASEGNATQSNIAALGRSTQVQIDQMDNATKTQMQGLVNQNAQLLQSNTAAATLFQTSSSAINNITQNSNMDSAAKTAAASQVWGNLQAQLSTLTTTSSLNLSGILNGNPYLGDSANQIPTSQSQADQASAAATKLQDAQTKAYNDAMANGTPIYTEPLAGYGSGAQGGP